MQSVFPFPKAARLSIPLVMLGGLILYILHGPAVGAPFWETALLIDFLITLPVLYFWLVRKTSVPTISAVAFFVLCLFTGKELLSQQSQPILALVQTWFLPILELLVFAYLIRQVRGALKTIGEEGLEFFDGLQQYTRQKFPKPIAAVLSAELATFYYGFFHWKSARKGPQDFTYHQSSGTIALLGVILFIVLVETVSIHFLVALWDARWAWVLTALSLYTMLQFFGIIRAIPHRPITLVEDGVLLRFSFVQSLKVSYAQIDAVDLGSCEPDKEKGVHFLSPIGHLEGANTRIVLREPHTMTGWYGGKKTVREVLVNLDDPSGFKVAVERKV